MKNMVHVRLMLFVALNAHVLSASQDAVCSQISKDAENSDLTAYLRGNRQEMDAACVRQALLTLNLRNLSSESLLIVQYLDVRAPRPDVITGRFLPVIWEQDGTWYPAANLLSRMGTNALPAIENMLSAKNEGKADVFHQIHLVNAAQLLFFIKRDDPIGALKLIAVAAEQAKDPDTRDALLVVAQKLSLRCQAEKRLACISILQRADH